MDWWFLTRASFVPHSLSCPFQKARDIYIYIYIYMLFIILVCSLEDILHFNFLRPWFYLRNYDFIIFNWHISNEYRKIYIFGCLRSCILKLFLFYSWKAETRDRVPGTNRHRKSPSFQKLDLVQEETRKLYSGSSEWVVKSNKTVGFSSGCTVRSSWNSNQNRNLNPGKSNIGCNCPKCA